MSTSLRTTGTSTPKTTSSPTASGRRPTVGSGPVHRDRGAPTSAGNEQARALTHGTSAEVSDCLGHRQNGKREVAALGADGLSNKEIAARLQVSVRTAQRHVDLLTKLGVTSHAQIAAWVRETEQEESPGA